MGPRTFADLAAFEGDYTPSTMQARLTATSVCIKKDTNKSYKQDALTRVCVFINLFIIIVTYIHNGRHDYSLDRHTLPSASHVHTFHHLNTFLSIFYLLEEEKH